MGGGLRPESPHSHRVTEKGVKKEDYVRPYYARMERRKRVQWKPDNTTTSRFELGVSTVGILRGDEGGAQ